MEFKTIVNAALKFLEKRIASAALTVSKPIEKLAGTLEKNSDTQSRSLARLEKAFESATKRMEKPSFDVNVDMDPLLAELKNIQQLMGVLAEKKGPDLKIAEGYLKLILSAIKENSPKEFPIDAMDAVFGKLKPKDSVKFDDKQMQGLMAALTGGRGNSMTVGGGVLAARTVAVDNVAMATADTEYSYTFPANTVGFELRLRADDVPLLVAYETGKLPTSGDGLAYLTVPAYFIEKTAGLDWSGKTIYVQAGTASQTLEVITYTA